MTSLRITLYREKVVESQYFTFCVCFVVLPRYQQIPG